VAGGLLSSWEAGIPPWRMIRAMGETWTPMMRDGGLNYPLFQALREREALSMHTMSSQNMVREWKNLALEAADLQPGGLAGAMRKIDEGYQWLLAGGPRATRWAGLTGFQFTENWLKASAYKAALDMGHRPNAAAELARIAVFDYSELPDALRFGRDFGVLLFPGFPYFMGLRTARAVFERPGVVAVADRVGEAITNAFTQDDEERLAVWANMPDWLRQEQGVPIARWEDRAGDTRMSFIPLNQLLPTNIFTGYNAYAESLATGGLYRPFVEALFAHVEGSGAAPFSARYGQQVFSPDQDGAERARATLSYLYNNLAPGFSKKLYSPSPTSDPSGLIPAITMPRDLVNGLYTFDEMDRNRADRDLKDMVISAFIRSPRQIAMEGPLIGIRNEFASAERDHNSIMQSLEGRRQRARAQNDMALARTITAEMQRREAEFRGKWSAWLQIATEANWD